MAENEGEQTDKPAARRDGGKFAKGSSGNPRGRRAATERIANVTPAPPPHPGQVQDAWASIVTGIGTRERDKRLSHTFAADTLSYPEAIALWTGDDIAKRAIESVPNECFREGYEVNFPDDSAGTQEYVERELKRLGVDEAIRITHCRERAFGGGGILLGANDGQTYDQPLDVDRVTSLDFATPFEPLVMRPIYYYNRASSPKYGEPSHYQISPMTMGASYENSAWTGAVAGLSNIDQVNVVHESRIIAFGGLRVSAYQSMSDMAGWGHSMLSRVVAILRDFQIACASVGILVSDFSQAVFKMEGLGNLLVKNDASTLRNRLAAIELARSTARAVLIDTKEDFQRQTTNIAGLADLLAWLSSRLAAAVEMPLTLLMGQSPKGLGNEGDSDIRFYYDQVASVQRHKIEPALRRVISLLLRVRGMAPDKWSVKFHPLWQLSDKERAEAQKTQAEADQIYVDMGALTSDEIRDQRFGGEYSFETSIEKAGPEPLIPTDPETLAALGRLPALADPAAPVAPQPGPGGASAKASLAGPQIASMLGVVTAANAKTITREQAIAMLAVAFNLDPGTAASLLGPAPVTPAPTTTPPPPAAPAPAAPQGTP